MSLSFRFVFEVFLVGAKTSGVFCSLELRLLGCFVFESVLCLLQRCAFSHQGWAATVRRGMWWKICKGFELDPRKQERVFNLLEVSGRACVSLYPAHPNKHW